MILQACAREGGPAGDRAVHRAVVPRRRRRRAAAAPLAHRARLTHAAPLPAPGVHHQGEFAELHALWVSKGHHMDLVTKTRGKFSK